MFLLIVVVHGMWMAGEMSIAACSKVFAMLLSVAIGLKLKRRLLRLPASQSGNVFMIINKIFLLFFVQQLKFMICCLYVCGYSACLHRFRWQCQAIKCT